MFKGKSWLVIPILIISLLILFTIGRQMWVSRPVYKQNLRERAHFGVMLPPKAGTKVLIFAPHEDDETLGCGGYIQQAVKAGADVRVVLMTNGEFPEIDVFLFEETLSLRPQSFIRLGYMRQKETLAAMKYLGVPADHVTFLGYPNEYLNQMWLPEHWLPDSPVQSVRTHSTSSPYNNSMTPHTIYCGQSVLQDVEKVLLREHPDIVMTLHPNDVHVDHWPTHTFVRFALEELTARGEEFAGRCIVHTYLIHRDNWPAPRGYHPNLVQEPPAPLVWIGQTKWIALPLTRAQTAAKHKATALYRTQAGSIDRLLLAFARRTELYGTFPVHSWAAERNGVTEAVIPDPKADLVLSAEYPHGDIERASVVRKNGRMMASIVTRGDIQEGMDYEISVHSGGSNAADRVIVHYFNLDTDPTGRMLKDGKVSKISDLDVGTSGRLITLNAPWLFDEKKAQFYMIRAWTTRGKRTIDRTASTTFRVPANP